MKLSNSPQPKQQLTFELERKKSYAFTVIVKDHLGVPMDLTGSTLRFVMKRDQFDHDPYDANFPTINITAALTAPAAGEAVVGIQAAELDGDPGTYYYSIVLWTADKYSLILAKGEVRLLPNTDSSSAAQMFSSPTPEDAVEIRLRGLDVASIVPTKPPTRLLPVATAYRPDAVKVGAGYQIFDTSLKRPLWSDGAEWVDANGIAR